MSNEQSLFNDETNRGQTEAGLVAFYDIGPGNGAGDCGSQSVSMLLPRACRRGVAAPSLAATRRWSSPLALAAAAARLAVVVAAARCVCARACGCVVRVRAAWWRCMLRFYCAQHVCASLVARC